MIVNAFIIFIIIFSLFLVNFASLFVLRLAVFKELTMLKIFIISFAVSLVLGGILSTIVLKEKYEKDSDTLAKIEKLGCIKLHGKNLALVNEVYQVPFKPGTYKVLLGATSIDHGYGVEELAELQMVSPDKRSVSRPMNLEMLKGFVPIKCPSF